MKPPDLSSASPAAQSSPSPHPAKFKLGLALAFVAVLLILAVSRFVQAPQPRRKPRIQQLKEEWKAILPTVYRILEQTRSLDVIALNPDGVRNESEVFHNFGVLGRATLSDASEVRALVAAYRQGLEEGGQPFLCFDPRHGIHIRDGDHELDLVICFHCTQGLLYLGTREQPFLISKSPELSFNKIFEKAGLQIAK